MVELFFASHNVGKIKEVQTLLSPLGVHVLSPRDLKVADHFEVVETGATFAENAELKARSFAAEITKTLPSHDPRQKEIWILADDSGLMVDALGGQPGVLSKRFVPGSDEDRNQAVIEKLATFRDFDQRVAHFVTVFCLFQPATKEIHFFEGQVDGEIAFAERGDEGFGYDSIFMPEGYQQTFGELGAEMKNEVSHRAKAAQQLVAFLQKETHE